MHIFSAYNKSTELKSFNSISSHHFRRSRSSSEFMWTFTSLHAIVSLIHFLIIYFYWLSLLHKQAQKDYLKKQTSFSPVRWKWIIVHWGAAEQRLGLTGPTTKMSNLVFTVNILEKLHNCFFFDDEIVTSMFFPTVHDAVLHVLQKHKNKNRGVSVRNKFSQTEHDSATTA